MEPEGPLPQKQNPATCPYPERINPVHAPIWLHEGPF